MMPTLWNARCSIRAKLHSEPWCLTLETFSASPKSKSCRLSCLAVSLLCGFSISSDICAFLIYVARNWENLLGMYQNSIYP
uniref:Uncharacterized protein n=1 Tax=Arundo donax TaxID=35708 RepID=A0A0A9DMA0_ARUDO